MYVGFENANSIVNEDAGFFAADVNMVVLNGTVSGSVAVMVSTVDGSATCKCIVSFSMHNYAGIKCIITHNQRQVILVESM